MESELSKLKHSITRSDANRLLQLVITWTPVLAFASLIFWFSHQPGFGEAHFFLNKMDSYFGDQAFFNKYYDAIVALDSVSSNIAHFVEYAVLALLTVWAFTRQWPHQRHLYKLAFLAVALYALSDEFHQFFIPGRYCDWRDVAMDWLGAAFAVGLIAIIRMVRK